MFTRTISYLHLDGYKHYRYGNTSNEWLQKYGAVQLKLFPETKIKPFD